MITRKFRTEKVSERITRIYAFSSELMYLVEGDEKAALLDSGSGIGFVKPLIESLTKKPLLVLLTHGHVDHAMGASEFPPENVYINQDDAYIYRPHSTYAFRRDGLFLMEGGESVTDEDFTPVVPIESYHDLKEDMSFDLGGVSVQVYACPGHTKGSLVFLLPETRTVLLGDACNSNTFLFEDYSLSVEAYQKSLEALKNKLFGKYDTALASHGDGILVPGVIDENIEICQKIMERRDDGVLMEFRGHKGRIALADAKPHHGNIVYNPGRIFGV
ncbi:MAG: MBL fold metallo-hydrolase [Bilifractor sp.]